MIVLFDLETTGTLVNEDRIVQIACLKVTENFAERDRYCTLVNPQMKIPKGAIEVHGITDEDVKDCKTFPEIADEVLEFFGDHDIGGFNILKFDMLLLQAELKRCHKVFNTAGRRVLDAMVIFHSYEKKNLESAYRLYCGEEIENAHDAFADTLATAAVLEAQINLYKNHKEKPLRSIDDVSVASIGNRATTDGKLCWNEEGEAYFSFGKMKDKTLRETAKTKEGRSYLEWTIYGDNKFSAEFREVMLNALHGEFPVRKEVEEEKTDDSERQDDQGEDETGPLQGGPED